MKKLQRHLHRQKDPPVADADSAPASSSDGGQTQPDSLPSQTTGLQTQPEGSTSNTGLLQGRPDHSPSQGACLQKQPEGSQSRAEFLHRHTEGPNSRISILQEQPECSASGSASRKEIAESFHSRSRAASSHEKSQLESLLSESVSLHGQPGSSNSRSPSLASEVLPSIDSDSTATRVPGNKLSEQEIFDLKDVKDFDGLQIVLDLVDKTIQDYEARKNSQTAWPEFVKANLDPSATLLSRLANACYPSGGTLRDVVTESRTTLAKVLKGLSNLHTAAAVLALVASVVSRMDKMKANKEDSFIFLKDLSNLGRHTISLFKISGASSNQERAAFEKKMVEACSLIASGSALCFKHLQSKSWKRGILADTYKKELMALRDAGMHLSQDLNFFAAVETYKTVREIHEMTSGIHEIIKGNDDTSNFYTEEPRFPKNCVGLDSKLNAVLQLLGVRSDSEIDSKVQAVLLHGMGGIGKSTLAEATCAKIYDCKGFHCVFAKVELGWNASAKIAELQQHLHKTLPWPKTRKTIENYRQGQLVLLEQIKSCHSPILLLIDNVYDPEDLATLLPDPLCLPEHSKVVLTSRDVRVARMFKVNGHSCKHYNVPGLDKGQAMAVLEHQLGESLRMEWAEHVLRKCGDLPLFLEIIGKYAKQKGNTVDVWTAINERLKEGHDLTGYKHSDDRVEKAFSLSYDMFSPHVQEAFLDICFLKTCDLDWVRAITSESDIQSLEDYSLVKRSTAKSTLEDLYDQWKRDPDFHKVPKARSTLHVHDLGAGFGVRKAGGTRLMLGNGEAVEDKCQDLERVEGLVTNSTFYELSAEKLDLINKSLRILVISGKFSGQCNQTPRKLQICSIRRGFPFKDIQSLQSLRVLDIRNAHKCNLEHVQLPKSLQIFKLFDVGIKNFHPDAFKDCHGSLHTLQIIGCDALTTLPDGFCHLEHLVVLVLARNSRLASLPSKDFHHLKSLQSIDVDHGIHRQHMELPLKIGSLPSLRGLFLTKYTRPSYSFAELKGLEYLCVDLEGNRLPSVDNLPLSSEQQKQKFGGFENLHSLQVMHARGIEQENLNCDDFSKFTCLRSIVLEDCAYLKKLPRGFENLPALQRLELRRCSKLRELPKDFSQLRHLERLDISDCRRLRKLPQGLERLSALRRLDLYGCASLQELTENFSQLTSLETLDLRGCTSLTKLPHGLAGLSTLLDLQIPSDGHGCANYQEVLWDLFHIPSARKMKELNLSGCLAPGEFLSGLKNCETLEVLNLSGQAQLRELPGEFCQLTSLKSLTLDGCASLKELPQGFGVLSALTRLNLQGCKSLGKLPEDFFKLSALQFLTLDECSSLEELPQELGALSALTHLHLRGCKNLYMLPEGLRALILLDLRGCTALRDLPSRCGGRQEFVRVFFLGSEPFVTDEVMKESADVYGAHKVLYQQAQL